MIANYSPSLGAVILKQVVALLGWSSEFITVGCEVAGAFAWGWRGVKSDVSHSSGRRHIRISCESGAGDFGNNFYFGLCTDESTISDRVFDPNLGNHVAFTSAHGGSPNYTGVLSEWAELGQTSEVVRYLDAGYLSKSWVYDIKADFDSNIAVFSVYDDLGGLRYSVDVEIPAGGWRLFFYNHASYLKLTEAGAMFFDFAGETFDVAPGYKAWDAQ